MPVQVELGSAEQAAEAAEERMKIALALEQPIPDTLRAVTQSLPRLPKRF